MSTGTKTKNAINITDCLTAITASVINSSPLFCNFDINRILICTSSNKSNSRGNIYGKLVPLKFKNGEDTLRYNNKYYKMPSIKFNDNTLLYVIYFYVPKFFDLSVKDKLNVIFHELYHINQDFNGDIRRMGEFKKAHGFSRKNFDLNYEDELNSYYNLLKQNDKAFSFLNMNMDSIKKNYTKIYSQKMKLPKPYIVNII